MNAQNFSNFLQQAAHLYQITYPELRSLALQYPYCQNIHLLLLQKSWFEKHRHYEHYLKKAALYVRDRQRLSKQFHDAPLAKEQSENFVMSADYLELIDLTGHGTSDATFADKRQSSVSFEDFETTNLKSMEHQDPKKNKSSQPVDLSKDRILFIEDLMADESTKKPAPPAKKKAATYQEPEPEEQVEELEDLPTNPGLIPFEITNDAELLKPVPKNSFSSWLKRYPSPRESIQYDLKQSGRMYVEEVRAKIGQEDVEKPVPAKKKKAKHKKSEASHSKPGDTLGKDEAASETLAAILAEQGNHDKAIEMYNRLSLIFPEKSTFFALQIQKIKNS